MAFILKILYNIFKRNTRGRGEFLKKNQKGFLLIEAIVVITFIFGILFFLFIQFNSLFHHFNKSFNYNTVEGVYRVKELRRFLLNTDFSDLIYELQGDSIFIEFSNCSFSNVVNYCQDIMLELDVKNAYMVDEDITGFQTYVKSTKAFGHLESYLDYIQYQRDYGGYRIIIEFNDGHFASINFL